MTAAPPPADAPPRRGCVIGLILVMLVGIVCIAGAFWFLRTEDPRGIGDDTAFVSESWKSAPRHSTVRLEMLRSLVGDVRLLGRKRTEIEQMLGPPAEERWSSMYPHPGWELGPGRVDWFDGPRTTGLILIFDGAGVCVGWWAWFDGEMSGGVPLRPAK